MKHLSSDSDPPRDPQPGHSQFSLRRSGIGRRVAILGLGAALAAGIGCSIIVDFDESRIVDGSDAVTFDATPVETASDDGAAEAVVEGGGSDGLADGEDALDAGDSQAASNDATDGADAAAEATDAAREAGPTDAPKEVTSSDATDAGSDAGNDGAADGGAADGGADGD